MSKPLVSVIVPAHNAKYYIAAAIESVLAQTHPCIEVIVVDDGSTDGTLRLLQAFSDPRIRVFTQANAGACVARNRALAEVRGDFVQFLDADDLLSPDKIERQVTLLEASPPGCLAVSGTIYFQDGTNPWEQEGDRGYPALNSDDPVQWLLDLWTPGPGYGPTRWGMVPLHAWLVPRSAIEQAGAWDAAITQDQDGEYFARVLLASSGIRWTHEGCACYRKFERPGSVSSGRSEGHLRGRLRAIDAKMRHVMPRTSAANREQAATALARQYMDAAFHAYPAFPDVTREAEERAFGLGGYQSVFFEHSGLGRHIERLLGWKTAKLLSMIINSRRVSSRLPSLGSR